MRTIEARESDDAASRGIPLKVTLPEAVFDELSTYADSKSLSKTEVIRSALQSRFAADPVWNRKLYVFQKRDAKDADKMALLERLKTAPIGTLLKIAGSAIDSPASATICICNMLKVSDHIVSFEIISSYARPTSLSDNIFMDKCNVSLNAGRLIVPHQVDMVTFIGPYQQYVYTVDVSYVWDADTSPPAYL
jgi:hypothetical protein